MHRLTFTCQLFSLFSCPMTAKDSPSWGPRAHWSEVILHFVGLVFHLECNVQAPLGKARLSELHLDHGSLPHSIQEPLLCVSMQMAWEAPMMISLTKASLRTPHLETQFLLRLVPRLLGKSPRSRGIQHDWDTRLLANERPGAFRPLFSAPSEREIKHWSCLDFQKPSSSVRSEVSG